MRGVGLRARRDQVREGELTLSVFRLPVNAVCLRVSLFCFLYFILAHSISVRCFDFSLAFGGEGASPAHFVRHVFFASIFCFLLRYKITSAKKNILIFIVYF